MVNEKLLATRDDFNPFMHSLRELIRLKSAVTCTLRNKRIVNVTYTNGDSGWLFHDPAWEYVWYNDGSSCTNKDFDLVQFNA